MKTYRCPYCGFTEFNFQDIHQQDITQELSQQESSHNDAVKPDSSQAGAHESSALPVRVQVKCVACHWVGTVEQLAGHHQAVTD
jgi:hypothetical protein